MDENELKDRNGQRVFRFWLGLLVILPGVIGLPYVLLHFGEGALLADIVKISLGVCPRNNVLNDMRH